MFAGPPPEYSLGSKVLLQNVATHCSVDLGLQYRGALHEDGRLACPYCNFPRSLKSSGKNTGLVQHCSIQGALGLMKH